jgi:hypothetical protein
VVAARELVTTTNQQDWRQPFIDRTIREDTTEARRLSRKVKSFVLIYGALLYKKEFLKNQAEMHPN